LCENVKKSGENGSERRPFLRIDCGVLRVGTDRVIPWKVAGRRNIDRLNENIFISYSGILALSACDVLRVVGFYPKL
jgi:hypothetical protein